MTNHHVDYRPQSLFIHAVDFTLYVHNIIEASIHAKLHSVNFMGSEMNKSLIGLQYIILHHS